MVGPFVGWLAFSWFSVGRLVFSWFLVGRMIGSFVRSFVRSFFVVFALFVDWLVRLLVGWFDD